jgi:ferredoxin-NADP reductase
MTWKTSRTGWYYRVIKEGSVKAGDEIRLIERRHPNWTIERIQEYLHRNKDNAAMNEELAAIEELGDESRGAFKQRVAKAKAKEKKLAMESQEPPQKWREFKIIETKRQTSRIKSFTLEATEPVDEPDSLSTGAHVKIQLPNNLIRRYSVVGGNSNRFELGIALEESSRGGSKYFHETAQVGHVIQVSSTIVSIPYISSTSNHIFVAGGIGITAFLRFAEAINGINYSCVIHYAVRSAEDIPFKDRLDKLGDKVVVLYDKQKGERMKISDIIDSMPFNSRLYFCGPKRMMDEAVKLTQEKHISETDAHFEAFEADVSGDPFEVVVANRNNTTFKVGSDESLLEVLQKQFDDIPSSCEVGNCGTCKITLKAGLVNHRGTALTHEERATTMLSCVSRGVGQIVVEV